MAKEFVWGLRCPYCRVIPTLSGKYYHKEDCRMALTFRRVRSSDLWMLYAWRKEDQTAYWSLKQPPNIEAHRLWMEQAPFDEGLYIAENGDKPVAVFGVSPTDEVSITVNPYLRKQGYGRQCIEFLKQKYDYLKAVVVLGNASGLRLFVTCGFDIKDAEYAKNRPCIILEWHHKEAA